MAVPLLWLRVFEVPYWIVKKCILKYRIDSIYPGRLRRYLPKINILGMRILRKKQ
jgi:hypothetical protein